MKKILFFLTVAAAMMSCNSKGNSNVEVVEIQDSISETMIPSMADAQTFVYQGILPATGYEGVQYTLVLQNQVNGEDSIYMLTMNYLGADNGSNKTVVSKGKKSTKVGVPGDKKAKVYQLAPDDGSKPINLIAEGDSALTMINDQFKKAMSDLNYTITLIK